MRQPVLRPTIGYIACDVYEEVSRSIWQGVAEYSREQDLNLIFYAGGALLDPVGFRRQSNVVYDLVHRSRVDGLVIVSSSLDFSASHAQMQDFLLRFQDLPVVSVEEAFPGVSSVLKDDFGGMSQAIAHLIEEHNRRRILFMQGPAASSCLQERYLAYRKVLADHGLPYDPNLVTPGTSSWSFEEAVASFSAYLDERALQPRIDFDAVAAVNDESAYAAITVLKARGASVPGDVSVTGFDDLALAGSVAPPLTTLRPPFKAMGRRAVEILLGRLRGEGLSDPVMLPAQLVVRHSCGCLLPTITEAVVRDPAAEDEALPVAEPRIAPGLAAGLDRDRSALVTEIARAVGMSSLAMQGASQLVNGLIGEIEHGSTGAFLSALDRVLNQVALQGGRIKEWQRAVSILRQRSLHFLKNSTDYHRADNLFHQARVMVGEAAWRHQSWKRLRTEDHARELRGIGSRLATAQDLSELIDILANELPALGVPRCFLSLYVDPAHPGESARLLLGYDEHGQVEVSPEQRIFPSNQLTPECAWPGKSRYSLLVEPLYLRTEQLGFILFETEGVEDERDGALWDALQMQLSSSLKAVLLHHEAENARREAEAGWQLAEERRRAAEEANQLKSRFLSMVSHEMRTPLNVIAGLSESLIQQRPSADANPAMNSYYRDLERIYASAQHLDSLIRDVLDLAVSHVGQLKLVFERLDVLEVLEPVMEMAERMAAEKGLAWRVEIPVRLPRISYDRTRLRQVVLNLVSNAVKFTERGGVLLRIEAVNDYVSFAVQDTGLGIPREEQGVIFEEFRRSERASARGYGGLGLGLAICRRLVELGGGKIGVESSGEMGGGSTFYFTLPALEENYAESLDIPESVVLLLRDGAGSQELPNQLAQGGFDVREIRIDRQVDWLRTALDSTPGAVVLDLNPSSGQGWEVINALKSSPELRDIPVLFCSLFPDRGAVLELNYLEKPIAGTRLVHALEQQGLVKDRPVVDILLVDDDPAILDLHARLVEQQLPGCRTHRAQNGREALAVMRRSRPDLVLLDLMMPEINGFEVLEEMRKSEDLRTVPVIVMTSQKLTEHEMQQLNNGVASVLEKGLFSPEETFCQLSAVLQRSKHLGSEARRVARLAMAYIHEHYHEPIARKDLANSARVSQEYLSTCFHRETGITPTDYLERYRIKQARRLLETTDLPITRVAMEVGFLDSSYFGRVFRREVGVSPLAYRRGDRR